MATVTTSNRAESTRPRAVGWSRRPSRGGPRRSPALIALAGLLVVGFALGTGLAVTRAGDKVSVLVVASDVDRGRLIERSDLTTTAVAGVPGALPGGDLDLLVGSTAAVDLVAGQVLIKDMLTDEPVPGAGETLVGLSLDPSRSPASGLEPGDLVRVVAIPAGSGGDVDSVDLDTPPVLTQAATIHAVTGGRDGGPVELALVVADGAANRVAAYATAGRVAVIEIPSAAK
jgi:hypothetical protein